MKALIERESAKRLARFCKIAGAMRQRGPRAVVVTIPGFGHAPALTVSGQLTLVERFFAASD